ncbi:MAG: pilus assembly protein PilM [Oscillospiraceae bacterium]|nr:pilus assembly protein PilM [Oscillospiraceae bacterium]
MLSFDISDRKIYAVKGENVGGKIKIDRSCEIDVPADMIVNGEVVNLTGVSDVILTKIREESMFDKNAILTFSSSNIVFKELVIPKAKPDQFLSMVQNQMIHEMGITNDFSISYTIVGEAGPDNPGAMKVLATACPFAVVESYRKLFNIMNISLKSANISCNSISRIVIADKSNANKMPLLVMQLDPNFLGMTLFENGQMAFARYVPIAEEDYDSEDYIIEAMTENIFRMTQFNKARGGPGIANVILYGQIEDYIKYADELAKMDISVSILPVPSQITGYENFEFTLYANAIGALYKRNKLTERINLIEIDSSTGRSTAANKQFLLYLLAGVAAVVVVIAAGKIALSAWNSSVEKDIDKINSEISATREKISTSTKYDRMLTKLNSYFTVVDNATKAFETLPLLELETYELLANLAIENGAIVSETATGFADFSYSIGGTVTISNVKFKSHEDMTNFVRAVDDSGMFYDYTFTGFNTETLKPSGDKDKDEDDDTTTPVVDAEGNLVYILPSMTVTLKEGDYEKLIAQQNPTTQEGANQ